MNYKQVQKIKSVIVQLNRLKRKLEKYDEHEEAKEKKRLAKRLVAEAKKSAKRNAKKNAPKAPRKHRKKKLWDDPVNDFPDDDFPFDDFPDDEPTQEFPDDDFDNDFSDDEPTQEFPDDDFIGNDADYGDEIELGALQDEFDPPLIDDEDETYEYASDEYDEDFDAAVDEMISEGGSEDDEETLVKQTVHDIVGWNDVDDETKFDDYSDTDEDVDGDVDVDEDKTDEEVDNWIDEAILTVVAESIEKLAKQNCPVDTGSLRDSIFHEVIKTKKIAYVAAGIGTYYNNGPQGPINYATFVHEGTRFMSGNKFLEDAAMSVMNAENQTSLDKKVSIRMMYDLTVSTHTHVVVAFIRLDDSANFSGGYDLGWAEDVGPEIYFYNI